MIKKYWWILAIAFMLFAKGYSNQFFIDKGYMQFDDTYETSYYEKFPQVDRNIAYESFPNVAHEVKVYYETFKQIEKNDFNEDYEFVYSKTNTNPLTILRVIRLITIGVN